MVFTAWIIGLVLGIGIGGLIEKRLAKKRCNHEWELIEEFKINNVYRDGSKHQVGMMKVYECKHCKELKQIRTEL